MKRCNVLRVMLYMAVVLFFICGCQAQLPNNLESMVSSEEASLSSISNLKSFRVVEIFHILDRRKCFLHKTR